MEYAFNLETGPTSNDGNEDTHFYSPSQWRTVGVKEGTVCTTIAVWCNDGKRSPSCVWYQVGNLIPKLQLYLIAVSNFHPSRSEASRPPEKNHPHSPPNITNPYRNRHYLRNAAWTSHISRESCNLNLASKYKLSASYFLRSCTLYPSFQKSHLSVEHEVALIFITASVWCSCTNIRQHYYLLLSKQE